MQSKYKVLANNTVVFAVGNILVKLVSFVLMPLYTSVLTTEQYAVSEMLNSIIEIVLPIISLCIIEALYRFSVDEDTNYNDAFMNSLYVIIIGDAVVLLICSVIQSFFGYQYGIVFGVLYMAVTYYKLTTQFARGLGFSKVYAVSGVINAIVLVFVNVILLVVLRGGVKEYLYSFIIAYFIAGSFAFVVAKEYKYINFKAGDTKLLKVMLAYAIPTIPNLLAWWINTVSDRYIIMAVLGTSVAGMYTAASKLPSIINLVSSVFQQAWQYSTAKEIESDDKDSFFSAVFRVYAPVCYMACSVLIIFTPIISKILFQKEFYDAWKYVPLLLVAATMGCFSTFFGTFFNAAKQNSVLMISTVVGALINIGLNFLLIPYYGVFAATATTLFSYIIVTVIRIIYSRKITKIIFPTGKNILTIILLVVEAILMSEGRFILYIVCIFVCACIFLLFYKEFKEMIKKMVLVIRRRK